MRRGIARAVVAAGAALALLAGCTGSPADPPTPPATSPAASPSPSPSPTPTPTPEPDAAVPPERPDMSRVDAETAEAVAVYFLQLYPYVYATGDLAEWRALSHPECVFCASVISNVEEMVAEGNHSEGGLVELGAVEVLTVSTDRWLATTTMTQEPSATLDESGAPVETFPERKEYDVAVALDSTDGGFRVLEVTPSRRGA